MAGNPLSKMFGSSPFTPIQQHMETSHAAASVLEQFFQAVLKQDWSEAAEHQKQIGKLENEADKMKKAIRLNLPKSLFLPVARTDLLDLVTRQDRIANCSKDIAGLMLGRKMLIPDKMSELMVEYVTGAIATCAQALVSIQEMDELLETGFRGREVKVVQQLIEELDRLEDSNDKVQVKVRAKLFSLEKDLPPVEVMFLYKIIERIGELADRAQKVGSRLQLLIAR